KRTKLPVCEAVQRLAKDRGTFCRRECQRVDTNVGVSPTVELEDIEGHDPVDGRDQDLASAQRERPVRRLEIWIANRIEDDVGTPAVRQVAYARRDVAGLGIDHI